MEKTMSHDRLQSECCLWFWNTHHEERLMWHHNNNNSVNRIAGSTKKALGVVAGVWDFEWNTAHGLTVWIDFKVGYDRLSDKQEQFRDTMKLRNRYALFFIVETVEQFKSLITELI